MDVGARLARVAQEIAYGERVVSAGPTYRSHSVRGDTIVVTFEHAAAGLTSRGTRASVGGFAIAGADRKFVWANATIAGSRVRVWSDQVTHPVAVRYAWDNNPDQANLFAQSGLPAAPFRTDRW